MYQFLLLRVVASWGFKVEEATSTRTNKHPTFFVALFIGENNVFVDETSTTRKTHEGVKEESEIIIIITRYYSK